MNDAAHTTYVLSFHAGYGCRERGACCTAGWPIPVERDRLDVIESHLNTGRLRPVAGAAAAVVRSPHAPDDAPAILALREQSCVFHDRAGHGCCEIHRVLGHAALPLACRQFPRVSVTEPRGTSVTLSHYCPTAAEMLDAAAPISIVPNAPGFPISGEYVGLDVREALPPLLRPDMLMDWESWWLFERESVALIDRAETASEALARLHAVVNAVRSWRPSEGPLDTRVRNAFRASTALNNFAGRTQSARSLILGVIQAIPNELRPQLEATPRAPARASEDARRGFLAAHAFASWAAHQGNGLLTWLRAIEAADALLGEGLDVQTADLWLRHLADPQELASQLRAAELP